MSDKVSMTAIAHGSYDAVPFEPGMVFDVDPFYVQTLVALGQARPTAEMTAGGHKRTKVAAVAHPADSPAPPHHHDGGHGSAPTSGSTPGTKPPTK
jgi:hypothetical protein